MAQFIFTMNRVSKARRPACAPHRGPHLRAAAPRRRPVRGRGSGEPAYKNILVSALGINKKPKVEIGEDHILTVGDAFLLASDGLWAYFTDEELADVLTTMPPREASEQLISLARERAEGRGDNLSLAIVKLDPPEPTARQ